MRIPLTTLVVATAISMGFSAPVLAQSSTIVAPQPTPSDPVQSIIDDIASTVGAATAGNRWIERLSPGGVVTGHLSVDQTAKLTDVHASHGSTLNGNQIYLSPGTTLGWADLDQSMKVDGLYIGRNGFVEGNGIYIEDSLAGHLDVDQSLRVYSSSVGQRGSLSVNQLRMGR